MTKRERDHIRFSFQKYKKGFEDKMKKGQIREGVEELNLEEYTSQYLIYMGLADAYAEQGQTIGIHELILSDSSTNEEPTVRALWKLLNERGIKTSLDVVRENTDRYFKVLRAYYPDDASYDDAMSDAFGW